MKKVLFLFALFIGSISSVYAFQSWEEDLDGDGRKETKFRDDDNDGNPDTALVDRDGDGIYEEYWVDADDDGNYDRMWIDTDGDGDWEIGKFDRDDDGDWDQQWTDRNGSGEVDGNGTEIDEVDAPNNGPRPAAAMAQREECNCFEDREEPSNYPTSEKANNIIWIIVAAIALGLLAVLFTRKKSADS